MSHSLKGTILGVALVVLAATAMAEAPSPEDFVIMPWGGMPDCSPETLQSIKDCGFNLSGFVGPDQVEAVRKAGLRCIVHTSLAKQAIYDGNDAARALELAKAVAAPLKNNPAVFGYYLKDEPASELFPVLGRFSKAVQQAHPGAWPYINLFPNYASSKQLGASSYDQYLEKYASEVKPRYISYDHYALMADGSLRDSYFQNLGSVRKAALKHGIPFWNIVLSNAHFTYAEPTPAGFRFQVFTTLAYGARGISYFTYFAPHIGNYRLAPIDQFGNKTPTWDMLRDVNLMIHALAPVYCQLKSVNVFHHPTVPKGGLGIASSVHLKNVGAKNAVIGEFTDPAGTPYVMIVNGSLTDSIPFDVEFKKQGKVEAISAYTGSARSFAGEMKWLAPGQGMLLRLVEGK